jgi:hypothetical protein
MPMAAAECRDGGVELGYVSRDDLARFRHPQAMIIAPTDSIGDCGKAAECGQQPIERPS